MNEASTPKLPWSARLSLVAASVWWGFSCVRSALGLVIPRDPVEYTVGALCLVILLLSARRLPLRGSILSLGLFSLYTVLQFAARGDFGRVPLLSLIQIIFPIAFFCLGYVLWRARGYTLPLKVFVLIMAVSALVGLANYYTGFAEPLFLLSKLDRAEVGGEVMQRGESLASGSLGTGLLSVLALLVTLGLPRRYLILLPIFALSLFSTLSRGGILALAAGIPVLLWFRMPRSPETRRHLTLASGLAAILLLVFVVATSPSSSGKGASGNVLYDRYVADLVNAKEEGNSSRIASWQNSIAVWTEAPIFGSGLGALGTIGVTDARLNGHEALAAESWYLQILGEMGIVGLALYLLVLVPIMLDGWVAIAKAPLDDRRRLAVSLMGGLVALAFGGIFLQNLSDLIGSLFWYFAGGLAGYQTDRLLSAPRQTLV